MKVYRIKNKETGEFWETPKGKYLWLKINHAKNAFACHTKHKISEQNEYEIVEYALVESEEYEKMKQAVGIIENGEGPGEEDGPWADGYGGRCK